ncbi:hypothetical protein GCM10009616_36240 [Microlunatus lacustris]
MAQAEAAEAVINWVAEQVTMPPAVALHRRLACDTAYRLLQRLEPVSELPVLGHRSVLAGADPPLGSLTDRLAVLRRPVATMPRSWAASRPGLVLAALDEDSAAEGALGHAARYSRVPTRTLLGAGEPREVIVEASWDARELVLGQPHRGRLSPRWLRSTSAAGARGGAVPGGGRAGGAGSG